jgi:hypothetical protein
MTMSQHGLRLLRVLDTLGPDCKISFRAACHESLLPSDLARDACLELRDLGLVRFRTEKFERVPPPHEPGPMLEAM